MSTTDTPTYSAPALTPTEPRNPWKVVTGITIAVMLVAVGILTTVAINQNDKAEAARDKTAEVTEQRDETRDDLAASEETLASTEDDLSTAKAEVAENETALEACAAVVSISDHEYESNLLMFDVAEAATDMRYTAGSAILDKVNKHSDAIDTILADGGWEYLDDVWAACAPAYVTL